MISLTPLRLYAYAGIAIGFLAVLGYAKWQHHAAQSARARADALQVQVDTAVDANASLTTTVEAQDAALKRWAALGVTPEEVHDQLDQIRRHKERSDELKAENDMLRAKDRALPECVALLKASLSKRCPSIAAGLVQLAAGSGQNSAGRDSGTRREAPTF